MKIRNGFVSNSSSSSFALFYKKEDILLNGHDLETWLKNNKFEDHDLWALMRGGPDGDFFRCEINKSILKVLLKHKTDWTKWRDYVEDRNLMILIDPVWKDEEDYEYGLCIRDPEYRKDYDKYEGEGYEWSEVSVDYHGPKTERDWKYEFGDMTYEQYWGHPQPQWGHK